MISEQELGKRIASQPDRFDGEPYLVAVQVPVADILRLLTHGRQPEEILARYPGIDRDDLLACLEFTRIQVEAAIGALQPGTEIERPSVDWNALQSRHGVSDDFLDAARRVFEQHDEILRRLA